MTATATSWKRVPFTDGVPIPYRANFNAQEFSRLKIGLIPRAMEDKWFIYYEEPHLFLHRSWTGLPIYRLTLENVPSGAEVTEALCTKDLAGPSEMGPDYCAQLVDYLVFTILLGQDKPFPRAPGVTERKG